MSTKLGSEKYSNYEYAPGIATYGIDGKDGSSGSNGTSIFVCQYDITSTSGSGITNFDNAILQNLVMSQNSSEKIGRSYINGDCFLFPDSNIYKITDITGLRNIAALNQLTSNNFTDYMELVGLINISDISTGFKTSGNHLILDTSIYNGFAINIAETDLNDIEAPFSIISNDIDNDNKIYFINLKSVYTSLTESNLNIYYDGNDNAFHLYSESPILIDGNLLVSNNTDDDFDEYSKVLTTDNSITKLLGICKNLSFDISAKLLNNNSTIISLTINNDNDIVYEELKDSNIHIVALKDGIVVKELFYSSKDISEHIANKFDDITLTDDYSNCDWRVSIIKSVEISITSK